MKENREAFAAIADAFEALQGQQESVTAGKLAVAVDRCRAATTEPAKPPTPRKRAAPKKAAAKKKKR